MRAIGGGGIAVQRGTSATVIATAGDVPGRPVGFFARLGAATEISSNRWEYAWEEVVLDSGAWVARTDGRTDETRDVAHNLAEVANSSSGVQGNGVDVDTLPDGFSLQPAPAGIVVWMHQVRERDGSAHGWWFAHQNGVDGECPEPEA